MDEDVLEQTLHISREVKVYRIPPRPPTGHKSGDWKVADEVYHKSSTTVHFASRPVLYDYSMRVKVAKRL
eukprot:scaffold322227_cov38-Prasinocladus_malaysianus.AAC.1